MSNTIALAIPELNGSNYSEWESTMTAYLRFSRAWGVVSGRDERPKETYSGTGADRVETTSAELKKEIREWDEKDDAAIGIITLKLPKGLRESMVKDSAQETWDEIKTQYGTPRAAGIFGIFKEAINFELREEADPAMPIANLRSIFTRLDDFGLRLTDQIQAMILLAALPRSWDNLAMTMLSQYDAKSLNLNNIASGIQDEYSRRTSIKNSESSLTARLSGIKRYGDHNSQWRDQKKQKGGAPKSGQQTPSAPAPQNKNKKPRRGKGKGKGKANQSAHESVQQPDSSVAQFSSAYVVNIPHASSSALKLDDLPNYEDEEEDPILANMKQEEEEVRLTWADEMYDMEITGEGDERLMY